jgi:hypothetical protein
LNISTGGSAVMTLDQSRRPPKRAEPEMCSLNMGTNEFCTLSGGGTVTDWKFDWEKPFLEDSDDLSSLKNTPVIMVRILKGNGPRSRRTV